MTLRPIEEVVAQTLQGYEPFDVEGDHSQHTEGIFVPDVERLKERIRTTLTSFAAEVRREERERIMQLFSHTEYIKRNDLVDALHPSDPTT